MLKPTIINFAKSVVFRKLKIDILSQDTALHLIYFYLFTKISTDVFFKLTLE